MVYSKTFIIWMIGVFAAQENKLYFYLNSTYSPKSLSPAYRAEAGCMGPGSTKLYSRLKLGRPSLQGRALALHISAPFPVTTQRLHIMYHKIMSAYSATHGGGVQLSAAPLMQSGGLVASLSRWSVLDGRKELPLIPDGNSPGIQPVGEGC